MFSIYIICLVSFHYLRRRRARRFYANRAERRSFPTYWICPSLRFVLYKHGALIVVVIIAIIIVIITIATTITIIIFPVASVLE